VRWTRVMVMVVAAVACVVGCGGQGSAPGSAPRAATAAQFIGAPAASEVCLASEILWRRQGASQVCSNGAYAAAARRPSGRLIDFINRVYSRWMSR